ncbi:MAG: GWxTD domain-containing protein [candidate division WOR-3 bacterium]
MILLFLLAPDFLGGEATATVIRLPQQGDTTIYMLRAVFPGKGLVFKRAENTYVASYEIGVDVRQGKKVIYTDYKRFSLESKTPFPPEDTLVIHDLLVYLPDGRYAFALRATDLNSKKVLLDRKIDVKAMEKGIRISDPLLVERDSGGLVVAGLSERDTMLFLITARAPSPETLMLRWLLVWESERMNLKSDSSLWVITGSDDTLVLPIVSKNLSAGQFLLKLEATSHGKVVCKRETRFWRFGINLLSSREFKGILSVLEFLYPGKTKSLKKALPQEREKAWEEFWKEVDPTPETDFNEALELFNSRYPKARESYRRFDGAIADMGKIYVKYGPPDEIERHPFELNTLPYEIWYYYEMGRVFVFIDRTGFGEYELVPPGFYGQFGF